MQRDIPNDKGIIIWLEISAELVVVTLKERKNEVVILIHDWCLEKDHGK